MPKAEELTIVIKDLKLAMLLRELAEEEGTTLDALVTSVLSSGIGQALEAGKRAEKGKGG